MKKKNYTKEQIEDLYEFFTEDYLDKYPGCYVPDTDSDDFKEWLKNNSKYF